MDTQPYRRGLISRSGPGHRPGEAVVASHLSSCCARFLSRCCSTRCSSQFFAGGSQPADSADGCPFALPASFG